MSCAPARGGHVGRRQGAVVSVAVLAAAAYAWFAAGTTPFTVAADVTTAVPLVLMAAVYVLQRARPDSGPWRRLTADRPPAGGTGIPWIALAVLLTGSELASFFAGPRATHPTVSSLTDTLFRWQAAKAAVYFAWLSLGWYLVRR